MMNQENPWVAESYTRVVNGKGQQLGIIIPHHGFRLEHVRLPAFRQTVPSPTPEPLAPDPEMDIVELWKDPCFEGWRHIGGPLHLVRGFLPVGQLPLPAPQILLAIKRVQFQEVMERLFSALAVELGVWEVN